MKKFLMYIILVLAGFQIMATVTSDQGSADVKVINGQSFNCSKYGPDSVKAIQYYSLYREYFKQENYSEAIKLLLAVAGKTSNIVTRQA